jgi:hypothetical protein
LGALRNAAAPSLAIEVAPGPVENAADIERVFDSFARVSDGGLLLPELTEIAFNPGAHMVPRRYHPFASVVEPKFRSPTFSGYLHL